jgi:hypothetical protein
MRRHLGAPKAAAQEHRQNRAVGQSLTMPPSCVLCPILAPLLLSPRCATKWRA